MKTCSLTNSMHLLASPQQGDIFMKTAKPTEAKTLTEKQKKELTALSKQPDACIDYSDIPPLTAEELGSMKRRYYKITPVKTRISIMIDADVLDAFKKAGKGYQTRMNDVLRQAVAEGKV